MIDEVLEEHIIFGFPGKSDLESVLNYCILLGKWYIYTTKLQDSNIFDMYEYLVKLKQRLQIETDLCMKEQRPSDLQKWNFIYEQL